VAVILGGVFSHDPAFDSLTELLPGSVFHTVCMLLGAQLITAGLARRNAEGAPSPG